MKAIDTNLVVRLIAGDDEAQRQIARTFIEAGDIMLLPTVVLEAAWVLRSSYGMARDRVAHGLLTLIAQGRITTLSRSAVTSALATYAVRGDFPDLLHAALAADAGASAIATFDRNFAIPEGTTLTIDLL